MYLIIQTSCYREKHTVRLKAYVSISLLATEENSPVLFSLSVSFTFSFPSSSLAQSPQLAGVWWCAAEKLVLISISWS